MDPFTDANTMIAICKMLDSARTVFCATRHNAASLDKLCRILVKNWDYLSFDAQISGDTTSYISDFLLMSSANADGGEDFMEMVQATVCNSLTLPLESADSTRAFKEMKEGG